MNGTWNIQVTQAGSYEFELYQRDKPANFPIEANTATLRIGDAEETVPVASGASGATIKMELPAGKTTMNSRFTTADGTERGAFFIYAKRL